MTRIAEVHTNVRIDTVSHTQAYRSVAWQLHRYGRRDELLLESLELFVRQHAVLVAGRGGNLVAVLAYAVTNPTPSRILAFKYSGCCNENCDQASD